MARWEHLELTVEVGRYTIDLGDVEDDELEATATDIQNALPNSEVKFGEGTIDINRIGCSQVDALDAVGGLGWELAGVAAREYTVFYVFKRQV